jgi:hypothetical protein
VRFAGKKPVAAAQQRPAKQATRQACSQLRFWAAPTPNHRKIAESRPNPGILRPTSLSVGRDLGNYSRNGHENRRFYNLKITKFDIQQNSAIRSKQRSKDVLLSAIVFISPVIGLAVQ